MLRILAIILLWGAFVLPTSGQTSVALPSSTQAAIDSMYEALLKQHEVVGTSIAIVDQGEIVYATGYGFADREKQLPATDTTVYRIGSVSKSFTALGIMQLHAAGKLDYRASLQDYLPELSMENRFEPDNPFYLNEVMSHVSGLPSDVFNGFFATNPPDMAWTLQQVQGQYTAVPRRHRLIYSNLGYGLLGEVIERQSGQGYADYLSEHVFAPLGMTQSYVHFDPAKGHSLATAYLDDEPTVEPEIRDVAAGLIHSSARDMAHYLQMWLQDGQYEGQTLLPGDLLAEMERDQIADIDLKMGMRYGYGFFSDSAQVFSLGENGEPIDSAARAFVHHGGDTYAYHADFGYLPELGVGAVVLTNTDEGRAVNSVEQLLQLYLEREQALSLNFEYREKGGPGTAERLLSAEEVPGIYPSALGLLQVENPDKIKFKQKPAKVVLRRDAETGLYQAKAWLFGLIPFKVKDQRFSFVEVGPRRYLKAEIPSQGMYQYIGVQGQGQPLSETWQARLGRYQNAGAHFEVPEGFPFDNRDLQLHLREEAGFIVAEIEAKVKELRGTWYLQPLDDWAAVSDNYGRSSGYSLRFDEQGRLHFQGFALEKVAESE